VLLLFIFFNKSSKMLTVPPSPFFVPESLAFETGSIPSSVHHVPVSFTGSRGCKFHLFHVVFFFLTQPSRTVRFRPHTFFDHFSRRPWICGSRLPSFSARYAGKRLPAGHTPTSCNFFNCGHQLGADSLRALPFSKPTSHRKPPLLFSVLLGCFSL